MALIVALLIGLAPSSNNRTSFPGDAEFAQRVYWRLARVQICLGDVAEGDASEPFYRKGEDLARRSLSIDSTKAPAHTWLAVALGSIAVFEGSKSKVRLCDEIKYHLDRALQIDPNDDVAYSILGSFYAALGNISWIERQLAKVFIGRIPDGGYDDAERAFKRAIALAPNVMRHHYALGLLYRSLDREDEARAEFERAAQLPILLARDVHDQETAREYLKELTRTN
jgi:tetratricopeptide (TPR) repeat protein